MSDVPSTELPPNRTRVLRMYTQHNFFFGMYISPIAALVVYLIPKPSGWAGGDGIDAIFSANGLFLLIALAGPVMGAFFFLKQGPLVIDPVAETLTYKRHVFSFDQLGLVRIGELQTMLPTGSSVESGLPGGTSKVNVGVVGSGDFMLSPDDQLPRRRLEKLANHLNAVLADYYQRKGEPIGPREDSVI